MPRDDNQSLGDEATLQGGKPAPAAERSLGDRSTFAGEPLRRSKIIGFRVALTTSQTASVHVAYKRARRI